MTILDFVIVNTPVFSAAIISSTDLRTRILLAAFASHFTKFSSNNGLYPASPGNADASGRAFI